MKQLPSLPFQKLQDLGKGCERVSDVLPLGELPKGCQIKAGRAQGTPKTLEGGGVDVLSMA